MASASGSTRSTSVGRRSTALPCGLTDWNGKPVGMQPGSGASKRNWPQSVECLSLPSGGTLRLFWDWEARVYRRLETAGPSGANVKLGAWPSRHDMMPVLRKIGGVPDGWERVYGGSGPTDQ